MGRFDIAVCVGHRVDDACSVIHEIVGLQSWRKQSAYVSHE